MQLLTDFAQWYDGIFDDQPPVFCRRAFSRGGLSKRAQFELFRALGLATPPHGLVRDLAEQARRGVAGHPAPDSWLEDAYCVVYLDEWSHCGEGKERMTLAAAVRDYPAHLASRFVPQLGGPIAFRLVRFGRWAFWLRQEGDPASWRSNRQDQERLLGKFPCVEANPIPRVLWAIDFVPSPFGLLAVDFNTAPQLVTLAESGALSPGEVDAELQQAAATAPRHLDQF